jgi:prevent-host-death family protein
MKTLSVRLPESIVTEIDAESGRRKLSKSDIVRERLLAGLGTGDGRRKVMNPSESVKPIGYLKSHTAEALRAVCERQRTMVITQHGEAKAVLQDIVSYERLQESLALLKILAQSSKSVANGRIRPLKAAFASARKRIKTNGA